MRYVERNPVRAKMISVRKAQRRPWSSISTPARNIDRALLDPVPIARGRNWKHWVNERQAKAELQAIQQSVNRDRPSGAEPWKKQTAKRRVLEHSMRPTVRPRKESTEKK